MPCVLEDICVRISEYYKPNVFSNHFYQCSYCNFCKFFFFIRAHIANLLLLLLFSSSPYYWFPYCINFYAWSAQELFCGLVYELILFEFSNGVPCLWSQPSPKEGGDVPSLSICGQPRLIFPLPHVLQLSGVLEASPKEGALFLLYISFRSCTG